MDCTRKISYTIRQGDNLYQLARYFQTTVSSILAQNPGLDPYDLQVARIITIYPGENFGAQHSTQNQPTCPNPSRQFALMSDMRKVWEQHVYWTRLLLISIAARLGDQAATTTRLMRNPGDIAAIFARFYSQETANLIQRLLTEHLQIGAALITALRDGHTAQAQKLKQQWYANADQMADAFASINPFYDREEMRKMLYTHLDLTTNEVAERLAGNYAADIQWFDKVETEALAMADYLSSGLMRQFPQKFN